MNLNIEDKLSYYPILDEDVKNGFRMFSALVYCGESVVYSQFLQNILKTESPRTIIKTTVEAIQLNIPEKELTRSGVNKFFEALDQIFDFQLGKILLATSSISEIQNMINKDWPFFLRYKKEIDLCFRGTNCKELLDLVNSTGLFSTFIPIYFISFIAQVEMKPPMKSVSFLPT